MPNLTESLKLRNKTAPSRVLFGAHCTNFAIHNLPNERHAAYYARRAAGGAGIIVMEEASVHSSDWPYEKAIRGYDERIVPRYQQIAAAVHSHGALLLAQLGHSGMQASGYVRKQVTFAPSAMANPATLEMPKVMEFTDIDAVVNGFAKSSSLAIAGNCDGVEINAGQYSLVRQFLSGLTNFRQDEYGGSLENRLRFARRVISAVRAAIGPENILGLRLSCDEYAPWAGIKPEDGVEIARELCVSGEVDYLVVVTGSIYTVFMTSPAMHTPAGNTLELATNVRQAIQKIAPNVAIFNGDTVVDPKVADSYLQDGKIDGFDMTRALIADPDLVAKLREGKLQEIRPCIRCNQDCVVRSPMNQVVSCITNPEAGYEREFPALERTKQPKRVLVVGSGPGGLEVARVLALRGHEVAIYEKESEVGGAVRLIVKAPHRAEMAGVIDWRVSELQRLNVPIETNVEVTAELIAKLQPDVVVVATGSKPQPSSVPGADLPHVISITDVLAGKTPGSQSVVVIDSEGYQAAINAAEYLTAQGRKVEFITEDNFISMQLGASQELTPWYTRAEASGIILSPMTVVTAIEPNQVRVRHRFGPPSSERVIADVDAVVLANYALPEDSLYKTLQAQNLIIYRIGDAVAPRRVTHAILEAQRVGRSI